MTMPGLLIYGHAMTKGLQFGLGAGLVAGTLLSRSLIWEEGWSRSRGRC